MSHTTRGLYFEECTQGRHFRHALHRTVTESDNTMITALTMNQSPLHLDAEYAAGTVHGQRIVNSLYTLGLVGGLHMLDLTFRTTLGNLGYEKVVFPKPVFHGDTVRLETTILRNRESASRTDAGIVWFEHSMFNQRDEVVCRAERVAMMLRRPVGDTSDPR
ncbi:MaoC family dehydratase [Rhodococcus fascians]|nr:MaoC family dehydratase [Rhodococcus fascians]MBY4238726.1 MaoC family dehydratase [Rhodococcus fascians]MBY4254685.1 MaoC family dehydratase [Rhodococcus fascians]MBY4270081.1 MaoC family dehydratase [Rhodococcus fascians]